MTQSDPAVHRRTVLGTVGAGTALAVAGCLGDEETLRMMTATEGTTAYAANEGLAAVVNDHSDEVFAEAQPSAGTEENIGALADEDTEMAYIQNWTIREIIEEEAPYDDLGFEPTQVFHFYQLPWFFVTNHDDIEGLTDVEGMQINPTPEGSGTAPALEQALDYAVDDYDRVSYDYGEQGSAMEEGRLDVAVGTYMNFSIDPGWQQEMMGTVDTYVVPIEEDVLAEWEDDEGIQVDSFPGEELENAADAPEETWTPVFEYNFLAREELDYDLVYSFLEALHENREELEDYHELLGAMADEEFFVELLYDDIPLHAAAYDYWEEQGLLEDHDYESADEP